MGKIRVFPGSVVLAAESKEQAKQEVQHAVYLQDEIADLRLEIHTQYFKTGNDDAQLTVSSHLDANDLPFENVDGKHCDKLTLTMVVFDENGEYVSGEEKVADLQLPQQTYEQVGKIRAADQGELCDKARELYSPPGGAGRGSAGWDDGGSRRR